MSAVRTLTALGATLGQNIPELARSAADQVTMPSLMGNAQLERSLEILLDRLCLSLTLAKPVGLAAWAERESLRVGRAGVVDMTGAATHTIGLAAGAFEIDQRRLLAFLDVLAGEVERGALGSEGGGLEEVPVPKRRPLCLGCWRTRLRNVLPLQGDRRVGAAPRNRYGPRQRCDRIYRALRACFTTSGRSRRPTRSCSSHRRSRSTSGT